MQRQLFLSCYKNVLECKLRRVAQPGSALAWGARGREFESRHADQFIARHQRLVGAVLSKLLSVLKGVKTAVYSEASECSAAW